jgi:uncharacterized protein (DUF2147 family)
LNTILVGLRATVLLAALSARAVATAPAAEAPKGAPAAPSPEGLWATVDDRSGTERALVRVTLTGDRLSGVIEHVHLRSDEAPDPTCTRCRGDRKGARVLGMTILWGHRADGLRWSNGRILDPENGHEYASTLWLPDADTMKVRGYWGPFYRTQTWRRQRQGRPADGAGSRGGVR